MMHAPVETFRGVVYPWQCDGMGHMNTQFYSALYDGATLHFLARLCPQAELKKLNYGWADVQQLIRYKSELVAGDLPVVCTSLIRMGNKSIEYRHQLCDAETGRVHSTSEQVTVLFDLERRASAPLSDAIRDSARRLVAAHPMNGTP
jgi:acyl-CoA thioester hydrolase